MARNDVRIRCNREALAAAHAAQVVAHADAHGRVNARRSHVVAGEEVGV